jgi:hypothetical protein
VGEVAQLPQSELEVAAPPGARVLVDGPPIAGVTTVSQGQHFLAVEAEGHERWAQVITVTGAHERVAPPLRPRSPPEGDRLLEVVHGRAARRIVLGALVRGDAGWRFVVREVDLASGKTVSDSAALDGAPVVTVVDALVHRVVAMPAASKPAPPLARRWWLWTAVGGVAAALAVVIPVAVVYGSSGGGNVAVRLP